MYHPLLVGRGLNFGVTTLQKETIAYITMYLFERAFPGLLIFYTLLISRVSAQYDINCIPKVRTDMEGSAVLRDTTAIQTITCALLQGGYHTFDLDNKNLPASNENILQVLKNATEIVTAVGTTDTGGCQIISTRPFFTNGLTK